jgi:hypothetical protein
MESKRVWFVSPSYPKYEVNEKGEVRSVKTKKLRKQTIMNGYATICVYMGQEDVKDKWGRKKILDLVYVGRLVFEAFHPLATLGGRLPRGMNRSGEGNRERDFEVDHIDRNKLNNSPSNLRYVTKIENMANKNVRALRGIQAVQTKYRGIRYYVRIWDNGKIIRLGKFSNFGEAFTIYHSAYIELHGELYEDASKIISQEIIDNDDINAFIYHYQ